MQQTRLLTRNGDYVTTVAVPPFLIPAEIINWGDRFFVHTADGEYREGMIWVSIDNGGLVLAT